MLFRNNHLVLRIKGKVAPNIEYAPASMADLGAVRPGHRVYKVVKFDSINHAPLHIASVSIAGDASASFACGVLHCRRDTGDFFIAAKGPPTEGVYVGLCTLKFSDSRPPSTLPVSFVVAGKNKKT
jgi:hypothetical protein